MCYWVTDINWTHIGAAWAHQDAKGFNLDVEMIPMKLGRFVVREAKPKQTGEGIRETAGIVNQAVENGAASVGILTNGFMPLV